MSCYCCGTCLYSCFDKEVRDYVCTNENSENYGVPTCYRETCDSYEESE